MGEERRYERRGEGKDNTRAERELKAQSTLYIFNVCSALCVCHSYTCWFVCIVCVVNVKEIEKGFLYLMQGQ